MRTSRQAEMGHLLSREPETMSPLSRHRLTWKGLSPSRSAVSNPGLLTARTCLPNHRSPKINSFLAAFMVIDWAWWTKLSCVLS
jgi:hypothetical protein